jgi:ubiquinone/menaquinone biosynthesis C-methylase UbiE
MLELRRVFGSYVAGVLGLLAPVKFKNFMEVRYWRKRLHQEGKFSNSHYEFFYTDFFGLSRKDYVGKSVLDIGCGPRGSLEWISKEADCTGVDPLVEKYRGLGIEEHTMNYVNAGVENIPFADGYFDIVTSFNNLDHVDDVGAAVSEIKRVTAKGGTFLLVTEVEHPATATEPQNLPRTIASFFGPEFCVVSQGICAVRDDHDIYRSLRDGNPFVEGEEGVVYARFVKT